MPEAFVTGVASHLPDRVVTNEQLQQENPDWDIGRIANKTGIVSRHIAAPGETAADLGFKAATRLLEGMGVDRNTVDTLIFCTQSPDYALPTTACILQDRLSLSTSCAALDINQGCSGYVYGLYLAKALVASGLSKVVLLITGETYSKFIHPRDRSVRVLFGDGASATLVTDVSGARLGEFVLGTDGSGHQNLIVRAGGARLPACAATRVEETDAGGSVRTAGHLFMDGPELFAFTLKRVPPLVHDLLARSHMDIADVRAFVFHQANAFMNNHLRSKLNIPLDKAPVRLANYGNTVSSTIPITLMDASSEFLPGENVMLVGFGVGYSWAACMLEWGELAIVRPSPQAAT